MSPETCFTPPKSSRERVRPLVRWPGCKIRSVATKNGGRKSVAGGTNATFGELVITPT